MLRNDIEEIDAFGIEVVAFTRDLNVRDVSVRQEFSVQAGSRHLFETGFDVHALRTGWGWTVGADMTEDLSRAMRFAVTGDPGPTASADRRGTAIAPAFDQRHHTCRGLVPGSLPAARRCAPRTWPADRSQRPRGRDDRSPRLGIRLDLTPRTRLRGAIGRYTQSPGYEKLLQSDYFVDLTSADSGQITSERSLHVIGAIERALTSSVTARVEAYVKTFDRLIVGRLETPAETAARVAPYAFPAAIASSVPSAPIITTDPVNGATGRAYGFDVYVEKPPQSRRDRLSGWASYTFGVANITSYGRQYPADYDRRHAAEPGRHGMAVTPARSRRHASGGVRLSDHAGGRRSRGGDARRRRQPGAAEGFDGAVHLERRSGRRRESQHGTVAGLRAARPACHVQSQAGDRPVADLRGNIQRPESRARQSDLL